MYFKIVGLAVLVYAMVCFALFPAHESLPEPTTTPDEIFQNLMSMASRDLYAVATLMEMVNGLERFRDFEKNSVSRVFQDPANDRYLLAL